LKKILIIVGEGLIIEDEMEREVGHERDRERERGGEGSVLWRKRSC
jgi:hypothetical protein